jgi:hypothetical protein
VDLPKTIKKYSVDYWYLNDIVNMGKIYKIALKRGYIPFVSDISLQNIPPIRYDSDLKTFILTEETEKDDNFGKQKN